MSSGAYDTPLSSSPFVPNESWRASTSIPSIYERPHHPPPRRRSPTPPRRIMSYDRYIPPRTASVYNEDYPNTYRPAPNSYRPDELSAYYTRSPSPDRYGPLRIPEADAWDRSIPWVPPVKNPTWQERKIAPPSPPTSISRGVRKETILATRMFEPSDAWKQHHDRLPSGDRSRRLSTDGYLSSGIREPHSPVRRGRSPIYHGGDSYRPVQTYREPYVRSEYDSYRPGWPPTSPINSRSRDPYGSSSRFEFNGRHASGSGSTPGSRSPHHRSPINKARHVPRRRSSSRADRSSSPRTRSSSRSRSRRHRSPSLRYRSISRGRRSLSLKRRSRSPALRASSSNKRSTNGTQPSNTHELQPLSLPLRGASLHRSPKVPASPRRSVSRPLSLVAGNSGVMLSKVLVIDKPAKNAQPRSLSRSSIASTHVSTREPSLSRDNLPPQTLSREFTTPEASRAIEIKSNPSVNASAQIESPCPPKLEGPLPGSILMDNFASGIATPALPSVCPASPELHKQLSPDNVIEAEIQLPALSPPQNTLSSNQILSSIQVDSIGKEKLTNGFPDNIQDLNPPGTPVPLHIDSGPTSPNHEVLSPPSSLNLTDSIAATQPIKQDLTPIIAEPITSPSHTQLTQAPSPKNEATLSRQTPPPEQRSIDRDVLNEQIARASETKSTTEALRLVVMTRLLCDRQTREELVNPVLLANQATAAESHDSGSPSTVDEVIAEITTGGRQEARMKTFATVQGSLVERFKERQDFLTAKTQRLREQYISLHERWVAHCATLNEEAKPSVPPETEPVSQPSGRTTRRSTANLGDAVRSDLEMEQIIASLGIDEATDPNQLSLRNLAIVPDMISVTHGKVDYVYDDTNHLIDNPGEYYGPHTGTHDWTDTEKAIFLDKFAAYPKQFGVIAEHIPNKTAAQCVDYYYLHKKKVIDFRKVISLYAPNKRRRRGMGKKKGNGLLADIRQHDAEVHRDSGSPTVSGRPGRGRRNMAPPEPRKTAASRRSTVQLEGTPTSTPTPEPDARPRRRRGPAPSASAPLSRTVSMSVDEAEEETDIERPAKRAKRTRKVKSAAIVTEEPASPAPEPKASDSTESGSRKKQQPTNIQWSDEDKSLFLGLLAQHGADFKRIAASMPNKTTIQVNNYYKSNLVELDLEKVAASAPRRSPSPERREPQKDTIYPGSGVMSPIAVTLRDSAPPMSSLRDDMPPLQVPTHTAVHTHARPFVHSESKHPTWATPSTPLPDVPLSNEKHHNMTRPISPSLVRGYTLSAGYPNVDLNGVYPSVPSYPSVSAVPYVYPPYADPHYNPYSMGRPMQHHAPIQPTPDQYMVANHRIPSVPSISRPENPYPIITGPGIPPTSYHYSLESS
ncbi:hypothetical protein BDZ94DRAFT_1184936 [Collybia nuda]|uniref:SANT domain-containing protein n=1 Tax=Collybia nuda TaxID=64659 RepID=A0A9P6CPP5_9AGAR|nr:hypothetical protein BDZ94DRAFT_1184936 [Collybia nuda]